MSNRRILGSETFGTSVVSTEEYLVLAEVMHDNGSSPKKIINEIEFIDDMLAARKIHLLSAPHIRLTKAGYARKNTAFSDLISSRLDTLIEENKKLD